MLAFNAFSIHDLAAMVVLMPLAGMFYAYWAFNWSRADLLVANALLCSAVGCLAMFMQDNVVPAGVASRSVPNAATATLAWVRVSWSASLIGMPTLLHFVLTYCGVRKWTGRRVWWLYAVSLAAIPSVLSDQAIRPAAAPLAETSSWQCALPWMPTFGPVIYVISALWFVVCGVSLWVLWRACPRNEGAGLDTGPQMDLRLVRMAMVGQTCALVAELVFTFAGYLGPAPFPLFGMLTGVLLAGAVFLQRFRLARQQAALDGELKLATGIQRGLLPKADPDIPGYELAGWSLSASHTGGDFYDFIPTRDGKWLLALGDATGHGMGPALMITQTRAILRAVSDQDSDPSALLRRTDWLLADDLPSGSFVTCFLGLLDPSADRLSYASAGHGPILFHERASGQLASEGGTLPPLGILSAAAGADDGQRVRDMAPGDLLVVVSDGFIEASRGGAEQFGAERFASAILRRRDLPLHEMIQQVHDEVIRFAGPGPREDDMTLVALRRRWDGSPAAGCPCPTVATA